MPAQRVVAEVMGVEEVEEELVFLAAQSYLDAQPVAGDTFEEVWLHVQTEGVHVLVGEAVPEGGGVLDEVEPVPALRAPDDDLADPGADA
jgi:hypothetical protein